jgi:hypothetical protein
MFKRNATFSLAISLHTRSVQSTGSNRSSSSDLELSTTVRRKLSSNPLTSQLDWQSLQQAERLKIY